MNGNPDARQVILAMSLSLATVLGARGLQYVNENNGRRLDNPLPNMGGIESFLAWGVILVFLVALADVEQTGALGASFAWLIFLAILFTYGIAAFNNLTVLMGGKITADFSQYQKSNTTTPAQQKGTAPR